MPISKQHILEEIRRTAAENNGVALGKQRFYAATGIKEADWSGVHWNRWNEAVEEAGFAPNRMQGKYDDKELLTRLAVFIRELGKYPTSRELRLKARETDLPSHNVFTRWGSKAECAAKVVNFCREHPEFEDVAALCEPVARTVKKKKTDKDDQEDVDFGWVYMLRGEKTKKYYIGLSSHPGRRHYQHATKLPEKLIEIHKFKTDDPRGIEKYWHTRFEEKRFYNEGSKTDWFELTKQDVAAFKRRRYFM